MKLCNILATVAWAGGIWVLGGQGLPAGTPPTPGSASAASIAATASPAAGPALVIDDADPDAAKAVGLESLDIAATLSGPLSQTTVTMTFRNNMNRPLEGNLEFPLPQGASVVGYGLDVPAGSGILVAGVAVEKQRARQIFESEERRRVDPGVLEQTRGNNYRTRVHPIPAGGTRTVSITYVADLASSGNHATYRLPLDFAGTLKSAKIHIEALGVTNPADLRVAGLEALAFTPQNIRLVADQSFANIALSGSLTITQTLGDGVYTAVEARPRPIAIDTMNAPAAPAESYFLLSALIDPPINAEVPRPGTIAIVWDTNLSRAATDKSAELAAIRALLTELKDVNVQLLTTADPQPKSFKITAGNSDALIQAINALTYDGALRIDNLLLAGTRDDRSDSQPRTARADIALLVTNGLVALGESHFAKFSGSHATVYTLSADPQSDHALLKRLAEDTGGLYLNLQRLKPDQAATTILEPRLVASLSWDQNKPLIQDVYPTGSVPIIPGQRINFSGRLLAAEATVTLSYGIPGGNVLTQEITLARPPAAAPQAPGALVPRFWAQQKAASLSDPKDADALLALAREFNLVTPATSLLVLETADQYVRYHVVPPKSRPEIYAEFNQRIEAEGLAQKKQDQEKIDHILALWKQRVDWWNTKFTAPTKDELAKADAAKPGAASSSQPIAVMNGREIPLQSTVPGASVASGGGGAAASAPGMGDGHADASGQPVNATEHLIPYADLMVYPDNWAGKSGTDAGGLTSTIAIKQWSPDTPYLRALSAATPETAYAAYLAQRKDYLASPSFYLDCANWFLNHNQRDLGIRLLTDIAQLRLENAPLLRVAAYRLMQIGQYDLAIDLFQQAKTLRPDEPQSWRDLALAISQEALARNWDEGRPNMAERQRQMDDLLHAMDLYNHVIMNQWDRFDEIEVVALMEANALWDKIQALPGYEMLSKQHPIISPLDPRLIKNLDCDVRIVMTWDADDTDIDLHVIEPTGQEAYYAYNRTLAGGLVSHDFTQGYGPEEYLIHHAVPGTYKIAANFYGSSQQSVQGPVTVQATVITNFGRPDEKRQSMTLRLTEQKETVPIGNVEIEPGK